MRYCKLVMMPVMIVGLIAWSTSNAAENADSTANSVDQPQNEASPPLSQSEMSEDNEDMSQDNVGIDKDATNKAATSQPESQTQMRSRESSSERSSSERSSRDLDTRRGTTGQNRDQEFKQNYGYQSEHKQGKVESSRNRRSEVTKHGRESIDSSDQRRITEGQGPCSDQTDKKKWSHSKSKKDANHNVYGYRGDGYESQGQQDRGEYYTAQGSTTDSSMSGSTTYTYASDSPCASPCQSVKASPCKEKKKFKLCSLCSWFSRSKTNDCGTERVSRCD